MRLPLRIQTILTLLAGLSIGAGALAAEPVCVRDDTCLGRFGADGACTAESGDAVASPYRLDSQLGIELRGACQARAEALLKTSTRETLPVTLYLQNTPMRGLALAPAQTAADRSRLVFTLHRDSEQEANRAAWTTLLGTPHAGSARELDLALAFGTELPVAVQTPGNPRSTVRFEIRDDASLAWIIGVTTVLALAAFVAFVLSDAVLRESRRGVYSLGRTQMAFWFLVVLGCLIAVYVITGSLEHLPSQVLVLLGISGATGLAAKLIGDRKTATLTRERDQLVAAHAAGGADFERHGGAARMVAVNASLATPTHTWRDFVGDICSDADGVSIYRVQVVVWTLTLGAVFVWTVAQVVAMPEFPTTLLTLLGISNSTYLGMKVPERQ